MIEDKYIVFAHVKDDEYPMCMTIKALSVLELSLIHISEPTRP